ncbi:MAG TPA: NUDIX domain-containing protein [Bacilli bacterium]|nr:NUDIX domain-containing protein [Bacilli bacterium]
MDVRCSQCNTQPALLCGGGVGGGQETGETLAECALREAQEELSLASGQVELLKR